MPILGWSVHTGSRRDEEADVASAEAHQGHGLYLQRSDSHLADFSGRQDFAVRRQDFDDGEVPRRVAALALLTFSETGGNFAGGIGGMRCPRPERFQFLTQRRQRHVLTPDGLADADDFLDRGRVNALFRQVGAKLGEEGRHANDAFGL